jgi:hypothetical protein
MSDSPYQRRIQGLRSQHPHDEKRKKGGLRVSFRLPLPQWQSIRTLCASRCSVATLALFTADPRLLSSEHHLIPSVSRVEAS